MEAAGRVGSAPRARGTAKVRARQSRRWRLSPACAGNGCRVWRRTLATTAQPRVRGERPAPLRLAPPSLGSAPRARGTAKLKQITREQIRLSPACAGNGQRRAGHVPRSAAQPRVRGERVINLNGTAQVPGSAPRARGTDTRRPARGGPVRLSPACAGNGERCARAGARAAAQPRVRGERHIPTTQHRTLVGSAPRARGTAVHAPPPSLPSRLSPACAGNGVSASADIFAMPAQPRVRGERPFANMRTPEHFSNARQLPANFSLSNEPVDPATTLPHPQRPDRSRTVRTHPPHRPGRPPRT